MAWVSDERTRLQWLEAVMLDHKLSANARLCGYWMAVRFNLKHGYAWPSYQHLAGEMGVNRTTAHRCVGKLIEGGWIERHKVNGRLNHYHLTLPKDLQPFVTGAVTMGEYLRQMTAALGGRFQ